MRERGGEKAEASFGTWNRNEIEFRRFHSKRNSFYSFNDKPFSFELTNSFPVIFHGLIFLLENWRRNDNGVSDIKRKILSEPRAKMERTAGLIGLVWTFDLFSYLKQLKYWSLEAKVSFVKRWLLWLIPNLTFFHQFNLKIKLRPVWAQKL